MGPSLGVTEDRVKVLLNQGFAEYEREVGSPRHRENIKKLDYLSAVWEQMKGALLFGKLIAGFIAFLCMAILALLSYLATHRQQSMLSTKSPTTFAQTLHSDLY